MFQIDTVGVEIETTTKLSQDFYKDNSVMNYFRTTHDASVETPVRSVTDRMYIEDFGNLPAIFRGLYGSTAGIEFVSNPLPFNEMEVAVTSLLRKLNKFGAKEEEDRAGIHIHCAYPISKNILLNTLKLSLAMESLLFHLGGLTYNFRGSSNESIFCRPLSSFGPPIVVDHNGHWIQLLDAEKVLSDTKDIASFWDLFGGIDINNPPNRYHPIRYFFVNMFSAMLHSTLEFRVFNTTLTPDYILACIRFCQEFTYLTARKKCPFDFVSSVYKPTFSSEELLSKFAYETELEPKWYKILLGILERTSPPVLKPVYVKTHLREYHPISVPYEPKIFSEGDFIESGFIDIHNIIPNSQPERHSRRIDNEREAPTRSLFRVPNLTRDLLAQENSRTSQNFNPTFVSSSTVEAPQTFTWNNVSVPNDPESDAILDESEESN